MSDSQHLPSTDTDSPSAVTTILWIVLVVSLMGNTITSFSSVPILANVALGLTALLCIGLLVARRLGRRS
ncbi:hypothetical protein [Aeromicrobium sp. NPDC092404]|uniref:hypothetical protein n=1 Tax=Aeromicrobium sp. NPDC092404 TaxID=3154976 RepID=UPI003422F5EA